MLFADEKEELELKAVICQTLLRQFLLTISKFVMGQHICSNGISTFFFAQCFLPIVFNLILSEEVYSHTACMYLVDPIRLLFSTKGGKRKGKRE